MRAVADQEHAPGSVPIRQLGRHRPGADVADDEVDVVSSDRAPHDPGAHVLGIRVGGLRFGVVRLHEDPGALDVVGDQGAQDLWIDQPVENGRPFPDDRAQIGSEMDHHEALEPVGTDHPDVERLAHPASGAVGGQHPMAAHVIAAPGVQVVDARGDTTGVLFERAPLVAIPDLGLGFLAHAIEQDGLEQVLRETQQRRQGVSEVRVALPLVGEPADLLAGELRHPHDV